MLKKLQPSIVVILCFILTACGGSESISEKRTNTHKNTHLSLNNLEMPNISASSFNTPGKLKAFVTIDDREPQIMVLDNENALLNVAGIETGEHLIRIDFVYYSDLFGDTTVATVSKDFDISKGENWLTITQDDYQIAGLDDDNDGVSNLYELTNPLQKSNPKISNNFPPEFISQSSFSMAENTVGPLNISARDANGHVMSYAIVGGADSHLFSIESGVGALRFLDSPNFEAPSDSDANNFYQVEIQATDELNAIATQMVTIEITDVNTEQESQSLSLVNEIPALLTRNEQYQIEVSALGSGIISYSSSDDAIVSISSNGLLTGKSSGLVTVFVSVAADGQYQAASLHFSIEVIADSFGVYGWLGNEGSELFLPLELEGVEFYRTADYGCDLSDYMTCRESSLDIVNEFDFYDTTARLDQVAYYTFAKENKVATSEFGGKPLLGRSSHQAVTFRDKLWVIAGYNRGYKNDVWSSTDGVLWQEEKAEAEFSPREGHQVVEFQNKLWLIGGVENDSYKNDVWSSEDGVHWTLEALNAEFSPRAEHQVVVFNDELWIVAGGESVDSSGAFNDVWRSSDGVHWEEVTSNAPFTARSGHQLVVYRDQLFLIGGEIGSSDLNDVWKSVDGETWVQSNSMKPPPYRAHHQVVERENKLWLMGGGSTFFSSGLWSSSDGEEWIRNSDVDQFDEMSGHQLVVYKNRFWVIEGNIWSSSNGTNWRKAINRQPDRDPSRGELVTFREKLWLVGGYEEGYKNDVWSSFDGLRWSLEVDEASFPGRSGHKLIVFKDKLFLIGGYDADGERKDIWSSVDGVHWDEELSEASFLNYDSEIIEYQNQLWLFGKVEDESSDMVKNWIVEIWKSNDGVNWQAVEQAKPINISGIHSIAVFENKLWLTYRNSSYNNSIRSSSDGMNWDWEEGFDTYTSRSLFQLVTFKDALFVIGGRTSVRSFNDIWSLVEGGSWTLETPSAEFSRAGFQIVEFDNQLIMVGGDSEIWKSSNGVNWKKGIYKTFQVK